MDPDSGSVTVVANVKDNKGNHDLEKGDLEVGANTPGVVSQAETKEGDIHARGSEPTELQFSNARLISLVLILSLAAFLNVC